MMNIGLLIFCYCIVAYGACNVIVFGSGPFRIFERLRAWSHDLNPHFGQLFSCMMCLPTNFGWIASLVDWFLVKSVAFTPFNLLFAGTNAWILAMLCDASFTTGIVWLIHHVEEWFENTAGSETSDGSAPMYEDNGIITAEDITNHESENE